MSFLGRTSKKIHPVYVYCLFWAHFLILVIFLISRVSNNIVCPTFECLLEWWFIFSVIYHRIFLVQNIMIDYTRWHYFGPQKFFLKCSRPMYLFNWVCLLLSTLTSTSLYFCTSIRYQIEANLIQLSTLPLKREVGGNFIFSSPIRGK